MAAKKYRNENDDVEEGDIVTPWEVTSKSEKGVDYDKLVTRFGSARVDKDFIARVESATGTRAHRFLRRDIFYCHRDMWMILDRHEQKKPFYLYSVALPLAESMHIGDLIPFVFTKWLQDTFDVPLVIQMNDAYSFLSRGGIGFDEAYKLAIEYSKDIIAFGFDVEKTFIFPDSKYIPSSPDFYATICKLWKQVTFNKARAIFGFSDSDSIGEIALPAIQVAPLFSTSFPQIFNNIPDIPCLSICMMDQDPYIRMVRPVASMLNLPKPATIQSVFLPALHGAKTKMSRSDPNDAIFLVDTAEQIKTKIEKYAHSGGGSTLEEHRKKGGDCDVDVSYQYLRIFMEDDERLEKIRQSYTSGELSTAEIKRETISLIQKIVAEHQKRRAKVTTEQVLEFMRPRKLKYDY